MGQAHYVQSLHLNETLRLNFFGHGYYVIYLITMQIGHACCGKLSQQNNPAINWISKQLDQCNGTPGKCNKRRRRGCWHGFNLLLILILLSGDVQLNPGPSTNLCMEGVGPSYERRGWRLRARGREARGREARTEAGDPHDTGNVAQSVRKEQEFWFFQTVNHARLIWEPWSKPKGILGAHLNIRSVQLPKPDQIQHLLIDSNPRLFSFVWNFHRNIPTSVIDVPCYICHRKDRTNDKGGVGGVYYTMWGTIWNVMKLNWTHRQNVWLWMLYYPRRWMLTLQCCIIHHPMMFYFTMTWTNFLNMLTVAINLSFLVILTLSGKRNVVEKNERGCY